MMKLARAALASCALFFTASCASDLVTGGPLVRPGEPVGAIDVANASGGQINVVLISACSASTYGLNRLPSNSAIPSGQAIDSRCRPDAGMLQQAAPARWWKAASASTSRPGRRCASISTEIVERWCLSGGEAVGFGAAPMGIASPDRWGESTRDYAAKRLAQIPACANATAEPAPAQTPIIRALPCRPLIELLKWATKTDIPG